MIRILKPWSFGKHMLLSILTVFIARYAIPPFPWRQAASIGIIGGADGPTSIFIASKVAPAYINYIVYAVLLILMILLYKPIRSMMNK